MLVISISLWPLHSTHSPEEKRKRERIAPMAKETIIICSRRGKLNLHTKRGSREWVKKGKKNAWQANTTANVVAKQMLDVIMS